MHERFLTNLSASYLRITAIDLVHNGTKRDPEYNEEYGLWHSEILRVKCYPETGNMSRSAESITTDLI